MDEELKVESVPKKQMGRPKGSGKNVLKQNDERGQLQIGEIIPLSKIESRSMVLEKTMLDQLNGLVAQTNRGRKNKVELSDVIANVILQARGNESQFEVKRSIKVESIITLPAYAWQFLEALAVESKADINEALEYLINKRITTSKNGDRNEK